jgi:hypothetical protein
MGFVRVVAAEREGGRKDASYKVVVICPINDKHNVVPGEWFGYVQNDKVKHPFVLERGVRFFYGGEEHAYEPTNFGQKQIEVGSFFTLSNDPRDPEVFEATYEITGVHAYDG